jgi:hypothetical protein
MFTPRLAIFVLATILRLDHVYNGHACGARVGFSNILSAGGGTLVAWALDCRLSPPPRSLLRRQDNMGQSQSKS